MFTFKFFTISLKIDDSHSGNMKLGFSARKLKNFLQRLRNRFQDDSITLLFTTFDITFIKSRHRILPVRTGSWEESGGIKAVSVLTISTREASSHFWNWKNEDNRSHKSKKNKKYFFRKNLSRKKAASLAFVSPGKRTPEANDFSLFSYFLESPLFRIFRKRDGRDNISYAFRLPP